MKSRNAKKAWLWPMALLVSMLSCQTAFAESDVVKFNERLMDLLPPGLILDSLKESKAKGALEMQAGYLDFGLGVCEALSRGSDKKSIMEKGLTASLGEPLSNAVYQAALDTLCPQHKK